MFENIKKLFKKSNKNEALNESSKTTAKERLHLVLMQDRANVSADFLDLMRLEIIEVIKKYIDIDESAMDVRLTNQANEDGTQGAPALYANIPIVSIKDENKSKYIKTENRNKEETETKLQDTSEKEENVSNILDLNDNEITEDKEETKTEEENESDVEVNGNSIENINDENNLEDTITLEEKEKIEEAKKIVEEESNNDNFEAMKKAQ